MYSLFIGLTLGGVPVVWRLIRANGIAPTRVSPGDPPRGLDRGGGRLRGDGGARVVPILGNAAGDAQRDGFLFLFLAGIAGASAMILPGVSGGYLLLVLGVYVPILAGVDAFKDGLKAKRHRGGHPGRRAGRGPAGRAWGCWPAWSASATCCAGCCKHYEEGDAWRAC